MQAQQQLIMNQAQDEEMFKIIEHKVLIENKYKPNPNKKKNFVRKPKNIPMNGQTPDFDQQNLPIRRNNDDPDEKNFYTLKDPIKETEHKKVGNRDGQK